MSDTVLGKAQVVIVERRAQYGHPREEWPRTARMWEALLGLAPGSIPPHMVGMMMQAMKLSRAAHKPQMDDFVDIAGYADGCWACLEAAP